MNAGALGRRSNAVLSGILDSQQRAVIKRAVINAHRRCGLRLLEYENREGWVTLTFAKTKLH